MLIPSVIVTLVFIKFLMTRFVDSIYSNFIIADPTTFEFGPASLHALYDPVSVVIVFIVCVVFSFIIFGSTRIEEFMDF